MQQRDSLIAPHEERILSKEEPSEAWDLEAITHYMEKQKPYLDSELKVNDPASALKVSSRLLSEQINKGFDMNFYEFVNQYRVEEFKDRALSNDYDHLTLLAIALDVGFNSKASFNRIFKKRVGLTPSQFIKSKKSQLQELRRHEAL